MIAKTDTLPARTSLRKAALLASLAVSSLALPTLAFAVEETKSDTIGPWEIEATFKGDKFDRCTIDRKLDDDIVASFVRTGDDLALELEIAELEARSRQDLSGEDECRPAQLRHRGRRRAELGVDGRQGQEICRQSALRQRAERGRCRRHDPRAARPKHGRFRAAGSMRGEEQPGGRSQPLLWFRHVGRNGRRV